MAQASNYFPSQGVSVWYQKEGVVGTSPDDNDLKRLLTTSFTIPEASAPVEYSANRSGQYVQTAGQGNHAEGTKLWTFDTVVKGTVDSVKLALESVLEDNSANPSELKNDYAFPVTSYKDGESANTFEIRFEDAGPSNTNNNIQCNGCVATGFTLSQDIASEGGELVCTINWATGYYPEYSNAGLGGTSAYDTGTPKNIRSLDTGSTYINNGTANQELVVSNWELNVTRSIERIHYQNTTSGNYKPFGYSMVGPFEVTGSITCVRNDDVYDLVAKYRDGNTCVLQIGESSGFTIECPKVYINEPTSDTGGAVLMQTIPFTVVGADDLGTSTRMLGVSIA